MVEEPNLIQKYNSFMGEVDRCDQNLSLYRTAVRGKKWYFLKIAHCLDLAEQNAWRLHKCQGGKLDHLTFRRQVVESILESYPNTSRRKGRPHSLEHAESRLDNKEQNRCRICHKKVKRQCYKCCVALHVECFPIYHKN